VIWCCASAYLSFFFTDCLMSRWLLNYTPQGTVWPTDTPMQNSEAQRHIATLALTVCYHITQRKINIKKEIAASISVFSIASFTSMCALLLQLHLTRENATVVPLAVIVKKTWNWVSQAVPDVLQPFVP